MAAARSTPLISDSASFPDSPPVSPISGRSPPSKQSFISRISALRRVTRFADKFYHETDKFGATVVLDTKGRRFLLTDEQKNMLALECIKKKKPILRRYVPTDSNGITFTEMITIPNLPSRHDAEVMAIINAYVPPELEPMLRDYLRGDVEQLRVLDQVATARGFANSALMIRQHDKDFKPYKAASKSVINAEKLARTIFRA